MEVKKIKDDNGVWMLELERESKTFANLISEELWNDKNVLEVAAIKEHPYMEEPKLFLKMKGKCKHPKALKDAAKRLEVKVKDFEKEFSRTFK